MKTMKKHLALIALLLITALTLTACGGTKKDEVTPLSFAQAVSFDTLKALDGKTVSITGYMATLSPVSGKYIYLMNMPYQSCPFCVPNTTQLANTMAVYAREGKTFEYTDQAVRVTGRMRIGDSTDEFGYQYNYRIEDATCEVVDLGQISEKYALWQSIASDGIVADISAMFDYVYFLCNWCEYEVNYTDENGELVHYFLWAGDADNYLKDDGPYGYARYAADGYFPGLIARVNAISKDDLTELSAMIADAQALAKDARAELDGGRYSFDEATQKNSLDNGEMLNARFDEIYARFSNWLAGWEL